MDKELKAKWVEALRSGKYEQGTGCLRSQRNNNFCCLGVLADVAGVEWEEREGCSAFKAHYLGSADSGVLPYALANELFPGVDGCRTDPEVTTSEGKQLCLSVLNDDGMSFKEIANLIEEQL